MRYHKTTILLYTLFLALCCFACTPEDTPDFELGRYEYAGIDNKTFRFFRVENGGTFREVSAKKTGIGELKNIPFCDEDLFGKLFYDCGLYPNTEKPYFEFSVNEVEFRILDNSAIPSEFVKVILPYKIESDSIFIGLEPHLFMFPKPIGQKNAIIELPWLLYFAQGAFQSFNLNLAEKAQTEQERLHEIATEEWLSVGDTILYCLFKERFIKQ